MEGWEPGTGGGTPELLPQILDAECQTRLAVLQGALSCDAHLCEDGMHLAIRPVAVLQRIPRWLKPYLVVSLVALIAAGAVSALLTKMLAVDPERLASLQTETTTEPSGDSTQQGKETPKAETQKNSGEAIKTAGGGARKLSYFLDPILKRNLFDSANSLSGSAQEETGTETEELRKSDLDVQLLATAEATDPRWSTALLSASADPPQVYRIGDPILTAVLHDIKRPWLDIDGAHHPARIVLKRDGQLEYVDAGGKKKKKKKGKKKGKAKDKKKKSRGRHEWTGIHDQGGGKFAIDQKEVDWALGNLDKLSREARVVPNFADGATNGFKVFSIRRNSALRKMGLKNNDVLTSVNGLDLSNTEKALEIYSKLQADKHFSLELLRNGESMTMEYDVQ